MIDERRRRIMTATADIPSIENMSQAAKQSLLTALLRDLFSDGRGMASVDDPSGKYFVLQAPTDARERAMESIRRRAPEERAELDRRASTPEDSLSIEEMSARLRAGAAAPTRRL
jgi:hypothetical protein